LPVNLSVECLLSQVPLVCYGSTTEAGQGHKLPSANFRFRRAHWPSAAVTKACYELPTTWWPLASDASRFLSRGEHVTRRYAAFDAFRAFDTETDPLRVHAVVNLLERPSLPAWEPHFLNG
jgi:hypothetical protein